MKKTLARRPDAWDSLGLTERLQATALWFAALCFAVAALWHLIRNSEVQSHVFGFVVFLALAVVWAELAQHVRLLSRPLWSYSVGLLALLLSYELYDWHGLYARFCALACALVLLSIATYWFGLALKKRPSGKPRSNGGRTDIWAVLCLIGLVICIPFIALYDTIKGADNGE